ncbi:MAG: type I secretion system permease/ATPase [Brevundimonas sp.]|nr:MAG: type I secretion system permease/ATPase [Brevundimonas sp.]
MKLFFLPVPKPFEFAAAACRSHFLAAGGFSALVNVLYLAPTIYMMQVYDRVVPTQGVLTLAWLTFVVAVAIGTLSALDAVRVRIMLRASIRLNRLLAGEILDRLMSRRKLGLNDPTTSQAMRDFDGVRQAIGGPATIALFDVPWTPLYLIVAFMIHPLLGVLIMIGGAILVMLALANERSSKAASVQSSRAAAIAYAGQDAALAKAEVVRALGMRRALVSRQVEGREEGLINGATAQFSAGRYTALVKFVRMFLQSLALGAAAWLAVKGQISVGAIIAGSVLLSRALQPIEQLVGVWPTIVQARESIKTLTTLFESTDALMSRRMTLPDPVGRVELTNVSVRNSDATTFLLRSVCLSLVPGEVVGLIGPSGAGKTTLARVAAGALQPDGGDVRIDDANFTDWDPEELARHIGYLPQDTALLPGTIAENISRFSIDGQCDPEQVDSKIIEAAAKAGVHEMILRLPGGYNLKIGDGGLNLSGGQVQRIALARALYGDPKVLVLDEPSSALDAEGEEAVRQAIAAARERNAAVLIVAHRSSILRGVDRLAVMNNGAIERQGPRQTIIDELDAVRTQQNVVNMRAR